MDKILNIGQQLNTEQQLFCPDCRNTVFKTRKVWESNYLTQQYQCSKCGSKTTRPVNSKGQHRILQFSENKRPNNMWEREIYNRILRNHGSPYRNGYPDILAKVNGYIIAIEVKPSQKTNLRPTQKEVMELLNSVGILCYKWNPQEGYVALFPDTLPIDQILAKQ